MRTFSRLLVFICATLVPALSVAQVGLVAPDVGPPQFAAYEWLGEDLPPLTSLRSAFETPHGYQRVEVASDSHAAWLRHLPVRVDRRTVFSRAGKRLTSPSAAVVFLNLLKHQQCADSAIRLHAEWLWHRDRHDRIAYHFTSGDRSGWRAWARGERFRVSGSSVKRLRSGRRSTGREAFEDYLEHLFTYAGTRSLRLDSERVEPGDARAGDFFVAPGSPGHAVVILDIVESKSGKRRALLGQGFMPTQEFHVLRSSAALDRVWFELPEAGGDFIKTPSWKAFRGDQLRRFD